MRIKEIVEWHSSPVAWRVTREMGWIDLPVAAGGSALDCFGDVESTFFTESLGELPMVAVARACGGRSGV